MNMGDQYDVPLVHALTDEIARLSAELELTREKLGWYERTQWVPRLKQERDRAERAEAELAALKERLRENVIAALPDHGGTCDGDDANPLPYDQRGLENPCYRCRVLRALAAAEQEASHD